MRPGRRAWLGAGVLLAAGIAVMVGARVVPPAVFALVVPLSCDETSGTLSVLLVWPLTVLLLVVLVFGSVDLGPSAPGRGELERLVHQKHRGTLLHRSQRVRENAARTGRRTADTGRPFASGRSPGDSPRHVLTRLVQLKRRGAWTPPAPEIPPARTSLLD